MSMTVGLVIIIYLAGSWLVLRFIQGASILDGRK